MTSNYFAVMFRCILGSLIVLVLAAVTKLPPWFGMVAAVAPLCYYHLFYLRPKCKNGLSPAAIDSVYYFGFLITVAALGISAVSLALSSAETSMNVIVYQFGVGLFATGYAVVARMHLTSVSTMVDDASPEAVMDRYVKRSIELVTNVEMASHQLEAFSASLLKTTVDLADKTRASVETTMLESAKLFQGEIQRTLESARESLTTIRGLVAETSFVAERKELALSMSATLATTTQLNAALDEFAARVRAGSEATQESATRTGDLDLALNTFVLQIEKFGGEQGVLAVASGSLAESSQTLAMCNDAMAKAAVGLSEIVDIVGDTGPTFKSMRTLTKKANEQLEALSSTTASLGDAAGKIVRAVAASGELADGMGRVTAALSPLTAGASALMDSMSGATTATAQLDRQLSAIPLHAADLKTMGEQVADTLDQIVDVIEDAVEHVGKLSAQSARSSQSLEGVTKVMTIVGQMDEAVQSLQAGMEGLSTSFKSSEKILSNSAAGIADSIARSSKSLETDVERSAKAASLLTERLAQVAQNIVDSTRQAESVR